jgi:hypothetical protein
LADSERGKKLGLRLALQFYRTNFRDDFVEMQYLKSWLVLEILYSRHSKISTIVSTNRFSRVRNAMSLLLRNCEQQGSLTNLERKQMSQKLGDVNRVGARAQALRFLDDIFADHALQRVSEEDLDVFYRIRNGIAHGGVMRHDGEGYQELLLLQHMRLKSLLERVFLAMLGEQANLMTFSWTHCYAGR